MNVYAAIGHFKGNENITCIALMQSSKKEFIRDELETLRDEEDEYRENIPESLQGGEKYELSESASDSMNEALDSLDEAIGSIESAAE